jgi:hypothetical protein
MGRMKTTLDLPDELLIAAKKKAAEQRRHCELLSKKDCELYSKVRGAGIKRGQ